jgi:uncharacterized protein YoxC
MTPEQLGNINMWLAVIAIASVIQVTALAAVALVGYKLYAKSSEAIDDIQRKIDPVTQRVTEVLNNANEQVARVRKLADTVEDKVSAVGHGVSAATSAVKTAVLPGWAVTRGVMAAVSALAGRDRDRHNGRLTAHDRQDFDETRFVNEGGNDARDEKLRFGSKQQ